MTILEQVRKMVSMHNEETPVFAVIEGQNVSLINGQFDIDGVKMFNQEKVAVHIWTNKK